MSAPATAVFAKLRRRILPLLALCYFVAFVDRVNVGFAQLGMKQDLGFSPVTYSWGAGIFFFGYFLLEVPSNLILERVGARRWIARIMVSWGILSMAMALVQGPASFYAMRFLLGAAEAGFFPGVILYLTYWFPASERARVTASFFLASPIASAVGGPISGALLGIHWAGLHGWQWLFVLEGAPAVIIGAIVWTRLRDRPDDAPWLTAAERDVLAAELAADLRARAVSTPLTLWQGLTQPRILLLSAIYFGCVAGNYGLTFWLPQIIKGFGVSDLETGLLYGLPFAIGTAAMLVWSAHSDRTGERIAHVAAPLLLVAASLLVTSQLQSPVWTMVFLCLAAVGIFANVPTFWALPTQIMVGTAAAGGIAFVNSLGNLSGFAAPYLIGLLKDRTGSFSVALAALAIFPIGAMLLMLPLRNRLRPPAAR
jgi:MFS family permease